MSLVKIAGHPLHPLLVTIPIGLWIFSLVCDLAHVQAGDARWAITAYFTLGGGVVGALLAAIPGLFDLRALHEGHERRIGKAHLTLDLSLVLIQAFNFLMRSQQDASTTLTLGLSVLAVLMLVISGTLGGHLVHVLGVTQPGRDAARAADPHSPGRLHPRT